MASDEQFCLRWNQHQNDLVSTFQSLLESGTLVDCTLAADGRYLQAHKVVLSACSPYFAMLLKDHYDKYPILILRDVKYEELQCLMHFVYRGEVNIARETLQSFLKTAESLKIRGFEDNSQNVEVNCGIIRNCSALISQQRRTSAPPPSCETQKQSPKNYVGSLPVVTAATATTVAGSVANTMTFKPSLEKLKNETLISSSSMSGTSPHNNIKLSNVCTVPSQAGSTLAFEGDANVPDTWIAPEIESSPMAIRPVKGNQAPHIVNNALNPTNAALLTDVLIKSESVKNELFHESYMMEESDAESNQNRHLSTTTNLPHHDNQPGSNELVLNTDSEMNVVVESSQNGCSEPNGELATLNDEDLNNGPFPSVDEPNNDSKMNVVVESSQNNCSDLGWEPNGERAIFNGKNLRNGSFPSFDEPINLSLKKCFFEIESPKPAKAMLGKIYRCAVSGCEKMFTKANERRYHEENEHETPLYRCSKCTKTFNSRSNLSYHERSHVIRGIFIKRKPWSRKKSKKTTSK